MNLTLRDVLTAAAALMGLISRLIDDGDDDLEDARTRVAVALQGAAPLIRDLAESWADRRDFEVMARGALAMALARAGFGGDDTSRPLWVNMARDAALLEALALWDEVSK